MASGNIGEFSRDLFILKPGEASFLEAFRFLLFPSDVSARKRLVRCPIKEAEKRLDSFSRRLAVFASLVVQKLLLLGKKRLSRSGYHVEMLLNLLSVNGGALGLLWNIMKGEVQQLDPGSDLFRSVIAHLDWRVDLDPNITHGDPKYNASLCIMAAKLAYENTAFCQLIITRHWKMEFMGYYNFWNDEQRAPSTGAVVFRDRNLIVVAFRGTRPFEAEDWRADVDISWYDLAGVGKAHSGFMEALGLQRDKGWPKEIENGNSVNDYAYYELRRLLRETLADDDHGTNNMKFIVTGHSLGGALAVLFASVLAIHGEERLLEKLEGVYTFGQPRVGDGQFGDYMTRKFRAYKVNYSRYVYGNDIVPRSPFDDKVLKFKHFGPCLFFSSWFYKGEVLQEEPNKNYFSLLWAVPKVLNAIWELIRGFVIPLVGGPEYTEGWLMKLMRLVGIAIPGVSAHIPQDYVNLTRLGSPIEDDCKLA